MADPIRLKDRATYLALADKARKEAEEATLTNVRERYLRAEAVWRDMAAKIERLEDMKATRLDPKEAS